MCLCFFIFGIYDAIKTKGEIKEARDFLQQTEILDADIIEVILSKTYKYSKIKIYKLIM